MKNLQDSLHYKILHIYGIFLYFYLYIHFFFLRHLRVSCRHDALLTLILNWKQCTAPSNSRVIQYRSFQQHPLRQIIITPLYLTIADGFSVASFFSQSLRLSELEASAHLNNDSVRACICTSWLLLSLTAPSISQVSWFSLHLLISSGMILSCVITLKGILKTFIFACLLLYRLCYKDAVLSCSRSQ